MVGGGEGRTAGRGPKVTRAAGIVLLLAVVAVVMVRDPVPAALVAAVALAAAALLDRRAVASLLRAGFTLALVFAAAVTFAVVAWAQGPERGLVSGALVLLRLLVLATAAAVASRRIDADRILESTSALGLERLGLVLGLALNSLPRIADTASEVWTAAAMRRTGRLDLVRRLPALGEVLLAHTARVADEAAAAAALRGHRALTAPRTGLDTPVRTIVVTGPTDGGKTTAVGELVRGLQAAGRPVAGFVQTAVRKEGRKVGFDVADLASGASARIATRVEHGQGEHGTQFVFERQGFDLARQALERADDASVLIVDELGPVELRGGGHLPAVRGALRRARPRAFVVVVRRALVPSLLAALGATDATVVDVEASGARAADEILEAIGETPARSIDLDAR